MALEAQMARYAFARPELLLLSNPDGRAFSRVAGLVREYGATAEGRADLQMTLLMSFFEYLNRRVPGGGK